jgi:hypothetical protein
MAAKADLDPLLRIAELVYQQTSPGGAGAKVPPAPRKRNWVSSACSRNKTSFLWSK